MNVTKMAYKRLDFVDHRTVAQLKAFFLSVAKLCVCMQKCVLFMKDGLSLLCVLTYGASAFRRKATRGGYFLLCRTGVGQNDREREREIKR